MTPTYLPNIDMKFHNEFLSCAQCVIFSLLLVQMSVAVVSSWDDECADCIIHEEIGVPPER